MKSKQNNNYIIFISILMIVGWGLECEEAEIDLGWGNCNDFDIA